MTSLRQAAQQALEFWDGTFGWSPGEAPRVDRLRAALAEPQECPNCASLEAQNTELDKRLAELERKPLTAAIRAALAEPQSTHSDDCYQWHHQCAIALVQRLRKEQNFCARCGKRTQDIHTCTPPEVHHE